LTYKPARRNARGFFIWALHVASFAGLGEAPRFLLIMEALLELE